MSAGTNAVGTDIVELLRHADEHSTQRINGSRIFRDAADEIERLRSDRAATNMMQRVLASDQIERAICYARSAPSLAELSERDKDVAELGARRALAALAEGMAVPQAPDRADIEREVLERAKAIVFEQPFYPDTDTGMRQQWVKDQIAARIDADIRALSPGQDGGQR